MALEVRLPTHFWHSTAEHFATECEKWAIDQEKWALHVITNDVGLKTASQLEVRVDRLREKC